MEGMDRKFEKVREITFDIYVYPNFTQQFDEISLHGCADASSKAYCKSIYVVCRHGERIHSQLLTPKTRVAPITQQTIPRLELIAAKILATLMYTARKALRPQVEVSDTKLWLD